METLARWLARLAPPLWVKLILAGACFWALVHGVSLARDSYEFYGGRFFHVTQRYGLAVPALERFVARRPRDPRACEAHLRLGRIYARNFGRYAEAQRHFEAAARGFPSRLSCALEAKAEIMDCPDFFPLESGRTWVYGDTASGGRNMRLEVEIRPAAGGKMAQLSSLFAGKKRISETTKEYAKKDWAVWEIAEGREAMVLRYPFRAGSVWQGKSGKETLSYRIEGEGLEVKTLAGTFSGCIKVRESDPRFRNSWKFDYYAPGVGRVKTTVGAPGVENPNTELTHYRTP
jgi:hypothetical protein